MAEHSCFTVSTTAYLRNLDLDDLREPCVAVHYQAPPEKTEAGTSIGLKFPMLIMSLYLVDQQAVAEKIARILNDHWNDPEPTTPGAPL